METFLQVLFAAIPVYLIITAGIGVRLRGILTAEADASLLRLLVNLLAPCLILDSLIGNTFATQPVNLIMGPLLGYGTVAIGIAMAWGAARMLRLPDISRRTYAFAVGLYNYGYIPIPLVLALFGRETLGVLFLFNIGTEISIWTLGVMVLRGGSWREGWKRIQWAPVIAVVLGVSINLTGTDVYVPDVVLRTFEMLGACAIPLGLLLIGATACDLRGDISLAPRWPEVSVGVLLRMILLPGFFVALALLPFLSPALQCVLIVQAAMPAAMLPIVLAKMEKGDVPLALSLVIVTSVLSFVTIPLAIKAGLWLIGHPNL